MRLSSALLALVLMGVMVNAKIFVAIPASSEACFDEVVDEGAPGLRGSFEVLVGGALDIDVTATKDGKVVMDKPASKRGDLDVAEGPGRYKVCFSNRMSTVTEKYVGFSLHGSLGELIEDEDVAKKEHIKPVSERVLLLADKVQRLQEMERYLTERLNRHIQTAESTSARVMVSTGIEAMVLLAVNLAQIWYLRRYFERKRTL